MYSFHAHIISRPVSDWRAGLSFVVDAYPSHFYPHNDKVVDFEGLGSYSWNQEPYNVTYATSVGFKTNWDLSGTFMP